jgi:hypothetical protein
MSRNSHVRELEEFGGTLLARGYLWKWAIAEGIWDPTHWWIALSVREGRDFSLSLYEVQRLVGLEAEDVPLELAKETHHPVLVKYLEDKMKN